MIKKVMYLLWALAFLVIFAPRGFAAQQDPGTPSVELARKSPDNQGDGASPAGELKSLTLEVFNPGEEGIFPVTSTLIYGERDAVLVDAQFQKRYAKHLVEMIKKSGKNLKYVFISHSDPDYYFGLDEIVKAFPKAEIISTAQTAYLISASKDAKLAVWKEQLGADAPEEIYIPAAIESDQLIVDGQAIEIRRSEDNTARSYLWIPSLKTVLGGVPVSAGKHVWMADTPTVRHIDLWISLIADMQSLHPEKVIPGHYTQSDLSPAALDFIKQYLEDYKTAVSAHKDSAGIISDMEKKYPGLPGKDTLAFSAKVFTGETPWRVASPYPPIGKTAEVTFDPGIFVLTFKDNKTMSYEGISGSFKGRKDTVEYTAVEIGPGVFMVYWHEPVSGNNVVHVQDWNKGIVYTNISAVDGSFTNLKGTLALKAS